MGLGVVEMPGEPYQKYLGSCIQLDISSFTQIGLECTVGRRSASGETPVI